MRATILAAVIAAITAIALGNPAMANEAHSTPPGEVLRQQAAAGNADAQFMLGMMYLSGDGVKNDDAQALHWLTLAADAQIAAAQSNLGFMYLNGRGVARNPVRAAEFLKIAADKGVTEARHNMGWMAQTGEGMPKDLAEAVRWYRLAADAGYSQSQYNLGLLLAVGEGVRQDLPQALKWLSLAAVSPRPDVRRQAEAKFRIVARAAPMDAVSSGMEDARKWLVVKRVY